MVIAPNGFQECPFSQQTKLPMKLQNKTTKGQ